MDIRIYFESLPLYSDQGNNFTIGYIDDGGNLIQIDNNDPLLEILILEPNNGKFINNKNTIIVSADNKNITLRLKINYQGFIKYFSFLLKKSIPKLSLDNIYKRLINLLPKNVYSNNIGSINYIDNLATATVIYQFYNNKNYNNNYYSLESVIDNMYPSSGSLGWEEYVTGSNRLLYQDVTQYGKLLEHIYRCEINNNTNTYWLSFNISKYIYLWINKKKYVYISENIITSINKAFILNQNTLGNSIFLTPNDSRDGNFVKIYICSDGEEIIKEEQEQINIFIRQIFRTSIAIKIYYDQSLSDLNLDTNLNDTYHGDIRQSQIFCIQYNQNVMDEALGYIGHEASIINITAFEIQLMDKNGDLIQLDKNNPNNLLLANSPYKVNNISTTPNISGNKYISYTQYFSDKMSSVAYYFDGQNQYILLNQIDDNVNLRVYLSAIFNSYIINIS